MEEIYTLPDGSTVDISSYSQFQKTLFLMNNAGAKKSKGTAKSASALPKKNAQSQEFQKITEEHRQKMGTVSKSGSGSSGSKKYRLLTEADVDKARKKGVLPPPSTIRFSEGDLGADSYEYDFKGNLSKKLNKPLPEYKYGKDYKPKHEETREVYLANKDNTSVKIDKKLNTETKYEPNRVDVNGVPDPFLNDLKIRQLEREKAKTDSALEHPYLYYSSYNQEKPDSFVKDNFNEMELEDLGINAQDFDGFLNKNKYKEDFLDKEQRGLFTKGTGVAGYDVELAKELQKKKLLTLYMSNIQSRDITRQTINQDIEITKGIRDKRDIKENIIFDDNKLINYVEKNFPIYTQKLKESEAKSRKIYEEAKTGGTDFWSWDTASKMTNATWNGFTNRVHQFSATVYDKIGMKDTAEYSRFMADQDAVETPDDRSVGYVGGKETYVDGKKYLVSSKGDVYDADLKIRVTDILEPKKREKIYENSKYGESGFVFSPQGVAIGTSAVIGDMILQAALTRGVGAFGTVATETRLALSVAGKQSQASQLFNSASSALKMIPMKRSTGYAMISQGALGYSQGFEETLKAARENGINDKEAFSLASNAAQRMGALYATTGVINPQTNVVDNLFTAKNVVKKAIEQYTKTGKKGFIQSLDDVVKNTPRNLVDFAEEGTKEVVQENVQQVGEIGLNKLTNQEAGKKILNEEYTASDFINTSILSFISSGLISKAKLPNFQAENSDINDLSSLSKLAQNKNQFIQTVDGLVDSKVFTIDEANNLKADVDTYSNNINKLPKGITPSAAMPVMKELDKVTKLENQKKSVDKAFHDEIDLEIEGVRSKIKDIVYSDQVKSKNENILTAIKKGVIKNIDLKTFGTSEELKQYLINDIGLPEQDAEFTSRQGGMMLSEEVLRGYSNDPESIKPGQKIILINEEKGRQSGTSEIVSHEFLHGLIYETVKDDPEIQRLLGTALSKEIMKLKDIVDAKGTGETPVPESFVKRFGQYVKFYEKLQKDQRDAYERFEIGKVEYEENIQTLLGNQWEEVLTLYSDAISNGSVKYDEGVFVKLKDVLRQVMQRLGIKDIEFKSGKDVYNFIKDYNKSVETGNFGLAMKKLGNQKANVDKVSLRKETGLKEPVSRPIQRSSNIDNTKFSLAERKPSEEIKKDVNKNYDKDKWGAGSALGRDENPAIERVLYDILSEYDYIIKGKAKVLNFANTPGYNDMDMISETYLQLMPHIRNFNKEFLQKREEFKKELQDQGLEVNSTEFKEKLEEQDKKGYQGKKGIVKENDDLNAWINSQLVNKMNAAMKSGNVSEEAFTDDIEGEMFKESRIVDGFTGDQSYLEDEGDSIFDSEQDFEEEQNKLAVLLSDPIYNFVDENGKPIEIETVPFGGFFVTDISDPSIAANIKLRTETDPTKIAELKKELNDLKRGLELQNKQDITFEEKEELKQLKSFKSYDLSTGMMVNTFKALSIQDTPAKIITDEVGREILKSPNIQTLEYRNFKEKLSTLSKTMARRMTFKNGPEIESLMYNEWKLLYDVINHPVDAVTGESSYASKKLPPRLKETDEKGNFTKVKEITRVRFLQSYYGIQEASRIIKTFGGDNANKELTEFDEPEVSEKDGNDLRPTTYFDRRTALMELFGDVLVLQEARRLIRNPEFLDRVSQRNVNLYNELKDDVIRAQVLNNMSKGKSDIVKFSLAEENNGKISNFLEGLPFSQQWVVARDIDNAINKGKNASETTVEFKVPSRSKFSDKETAYFVIQKVAEGYNDFSFEVEENSKGPLTQQVLQALDIKSKQYQEQADRNNNIEKTINDFIEENKGVASAETFSPETAKNIGKNIGKYEMYLPPEDEDFLGLLYTLAGAKGKKGDEQLKFLTDTLLKPYSDAMLNLMKSRQTMYKDWQDLINKKHKGISKLLKQDSGYGGYLVDQAVRVYLWSAAGYEIPGLDKKDLFNLREIVRTNPKLRSFANDVSLLSKQANGYTEPGHNWGFGSVVSDINGVISKSNRKKYLEQWQNNIDKAFSKDNLSKIEAVYGRKYVTALKNSLDRMKTGSNRAEGSNDAFLNWLNGATAVTMFTNVRSAFLQTLGAVNYLNTSDNNIVKAGAAFLNVPQFLKDFKTIWNSDYSKDRRSGLTNDIAEAELAQIMNDPRNKSILDKFKAANYWILKKGYGPTRFADSFAIAFGGASFYRNRLNAYMKEGKTEAEAEKETMRDFYEVSESSQQSADVSKISMNQASTKGRILLSFLNTPFQYSRIIKRSVVDLAKGRGDVANNIAKIVYYSAIQNIMFNFLQNALFSIIWDDDDERDETGKGKFDQAKIRAVSGSLDTLLRGSGLQGVIVSTVKNIIIKWYEKSGDPKGYGDVLLEAANIAPSIGIKARALAKSYKAVEYNKDEIEYKGFSLDNTYALEALTSLTSAATNVPVDRLMQKTENIGNALNEEYEMWQRVAFAMGYNKWNLGINDEKMVSTNAQGDLKIPELKQDELKTPELK